MLNNPKFSVLDGHIDTIKKISRDKRDFSVRSEVGHYDLPRMEEGNVQAAIFAIYPASSTNRILKGLDLWFKFVFNPINGLMQIKRIDDFAKIQASGKRG